MKHTQAFQDSLNEYCSLSPVKPANKAAQPKHADLYLYGVIGSKYANIDKFNRELSAAGKVDTITLYLNTVGGTFADGLPIYNMLRQHKAHVTIKIMGYALSMGSVIMLAGNRIECAENALIMIHRAHGFTWGDAQTHKKAMDILDKHDQAIIPNYIKRMGKTESQVKKLLQDETWYTAPQAKAAGLVDTLTDEVDIDTDAAKRGAENMAITAHYRSAPAAFTNTFQHCSFC